MKSFFVLFLAMAATVVADRTITVSNACPFTVWPALFTSSGGRPSQATGWSAPSHTKHSFNVPGDWDGRVWGRRNCDFSKNPGANSCLDGGCNGGLECDTKTGTGVPPATLAEFKFKGAGNKDYYDVSLVDGYNLPMRIDNNVGCGIPSCPVDLGPNCPGEQKGPFDKSGFPVGCKSACTVDALNGRAANSPNCCSGSHNTPATCPASGVTNYHYFKDNCPNAYAFAYDEPSGTALWSCPSDKNAAYTITFCPPHSKSSEEQMWGSEAQTPLVL
ncbi:thaumatin-like protein [Mycena maculata]|uniref:Thaumatin-like protein n=1 Tax=Mycena maculata TaxID=230809 RepID=A0AAD7N110_9AGAR|nr:thaumatin-like protein [Mycena maculata]